MDSIYREFFFQKRGADKQITIELLWGQDYTLRLQMKIENYSRGDSIPKPF